MPPAAVGLLGGCGIAVESGESGRSFSRLVQTGSRPLHAEVVTRPWIFLAWPCLAALPCYGEARE